MSDKIGVSLEGCAVKRLTERMDCDKNKMRVLKKTNPTVQSSPGVGNRSYFNPIVTTQMAKIRQSQGNHYNSGLLGQTRGYPDNQSILPETVSSPRERVMCVCCRERKRERESRLGSKRPDGVLVGQPCVGHYSGPLSSKQNKAR